MDQTLPDYEVRAALPQFCAADPTMTRWRPSRAWCSNAVAHRVAIDCYLAARWIDLSATDLRVVRPVGGSRAPPPPTLPPHGQRFADLPDPFSPLVALWETGYALDVLTADAVSLVCPALP